MEKFVYIIWCGDLVSLKFEIIIVDVFFEFECVGKIWYVFECLLSDSKGGYCFFDFMIEKD